MIDLVTNRRLGRRQFIGTAGALVTPVIAACSSDDDELRPTTDPSVGANPKEAPMLTDLVAAGDLPTLEERLPETPLVVEPVDRVGVYGGTWRSALLGPADRAVLIRSIGYDPLLSWDREFTEPIPNIAASFDASAEGREFTFLLRPGMKWSDGEPFTARDVEFAYADVLRNEEIFPSPPDWLLAGEEPPTVEVIDEVTIRFTFAAPHGLFLYRLAEPNGRQLVTFPRHYFEQFHPDYNPAAEDMAAEAGFENWADLFSGANEWSSAERPTLNAWRLTEPLGEGSRVVAERNPYYWKTDPGGSQLPYLDQVVFTVMADAEVMLLSATNGEIDMHGRHFNTPENKPVVASGRADGNYDFFALLGPPNDLQIYLNLTHEDAALRVAFSNKDFRIGLSHAINREEIIAAVYQQQGEPWQIAPRPESPLYDEEMAKQYTEYSIDLANEHLDRAGFTERDGDGFRLLSNGERISFTVDSPAGLFPNFPPALELITGYWQEVGIDMRLSVIDRSLYVERRAGNQHDANVWGGGGTVPTTLSRILVPPVPITSGASYAVLWADWYTSGGATGEEPAEPARRAIELYEEILITVDPKKQEQLIRQIQQIVKEEFWTMGIVLLPPGYGIVKNNFHNVPKSMYDNWRWPTPGPSRPEQYFFLRHERGEGP